MDTLCRKSLSGFDPVCKERKEVQTYAGFQTIEFKGLATMVAIQLPSQRFHCHLCLLFSRSTQRLCVIPFVCRNCEWSRATSPCTARRWCACLHGRTAKAPCTTCCSRSKKNFPRCESVSICLGSSLQSRLWWWNQRNTNVQPNIPESPITQRRCVSRRETLPTAWDTWLQAEFRSRDLILPPAQKSDISSALSLPPPLPPLSWCTLPSFFRSSVMLGQRLWAVINQHSLPVSLMAPDDRECSSLPPPHSGCRPRRRLPVMSPHPSFNRPKCSVVIWKGGGARYPWSGPSCHPHWRAERQEQVQAPGGGGQSESRHGHAWS